MKRISIDIEKLAMMKDAVIGKDAPSSENLLDDLFNIIYLQKSDEIIGFVGDYPTFASIGCNIVEVFFVSPYLQSKRKSIDAWKRKVIDALTDCYIDNIDEKYIDILDEEAGIVYSFVVQKRSLRIVLRVYDEKLV